MSLLRTAVLMLGLLTLLTGVVYPLVITGVAQACPNRASGSLITRDGKVVGSMLIGQEFSDAKYFWGRLSATTPAPYTAYNGETRTGSSGSNLAPTSEALVANARRRIDALAAADMAVGYRRSAESRVPVDLVTSSGSGLDPHISRAAAEYQLPRVARARGLDEERVRSIVSQHTRARQLGMLGEPVVHVVELNLALDAVKP